jgi:hypothetical protein
MLLPVLSTCLEGARTGREDTTQHQESKQTKTRTNDNKWHYLLCLLIKGGQHPVKKIESLVLS